MIIKLQPFDLMFHLLHFGILAHFVLFGPLQKLPALLILLCHFTFQILYLFVLLLALQFDCLELIVLST